MKRPCGSKYLFMLACSIVLLQNCTPPKGWQGVYKSYGGGPTSYSYSGSGKRNKIVQLARRNLGVPYRFGGESPRGFDCSGLTSYVYKKAAGIVLARTSKAQARQGRRVRVPRPGDLVFFNTGSRASHVGIYIGKGSFIHAPRTGKNVEISSIKSKYWRKRYLFSKAMI